MDTFSILWFIVFVLAALVWGVQISIWASRIGADVRSIKGTLERIERQQAAAAVALGQPATPVSRASAPSIDVEPFVE
jgi:hypothetical protein